jgi:hypothetical protein
MGEGRGIRSIPETSYLTCSVIDHRSSTILWAEPAQSLFGCVSSDRAAILVPILSFWSPERCRI